MLETEQHISHFALSIGGTNAPSDLMDALLDCTIENSLHLPDMCAIRFHDYDFKWLDNELLSEGHSIEVKGGSEEDPHQQLFHGEIVALEVDMVAHGTATLLVRCYDRSHRLHRGKLSRTFSNTKDSDIVKKIGGELGFNVHMDQTRGVHDWIIQNNQTNWEFLQERAAYNGFRLFVKGEKDLYFQKVKDSGEGTVEVSWGDELRSFRPRRSAAGQVDEVEVRGWDPHTKAKIVGIHKVPSGVPKVGDPRHDGQVAKKAYGAARHVVVDRPIHSQSEAEELAKSVCDKIAGEFLQAEGLCFGRPDIKPGKTIKIANIGKRFSGEYYVTSTQHTYTPSEGYASQFSVDGKSPSTLLHLLNGSGGTSSNGNGTGDKLGGNIVIGIVTDNKDPKGEGRVKVKYPWLTESHTSYWARQCSQMAGKGRGMYNIPEIQDEVLIAFEHGDMRRPYILGQLWNGKDGMSGISGNPMHGSGSETNRRGLHSRVGHKMELDDTGGGGVTLTTQGGHVVHMHDGGPSITLTTTAGLKCHLMDTSMTVLCSTPGGQSMTLTDSGSLIKLQDNAGDVMTMSNGMINVTASTMMNLSAPMININGAISVTINGMVVTIDAGAMAAVNSGALTSVVSGNAVFVGAGSMLKATAGAAAEISAGAGIDIDGSTAVAIKAATVALN